MKKSLNDLIQFRLKRTDETMEEAKALVRIERWNGVVNRLYYSAFYAVSALLYKEGIYSKTHSGQKSLFYANIIKTGKLPGENGNVYTRLFEYRQDGDYGDFITFDKDEVEVLVERTEELVNEIKKLIN